MSPREILRDLWLGLGAASACCGSACEPVVSAAETFRPPAGEVVVLLHGWWANRWVLSRMQWSLSRAGYHVVNIGYPSVWVPVEELATNQLPKIFARRVPSDARRVHFVTHSMGGLLLREYLRYGSPTNLGRIVLLGPPNHGSELADGRHWLLTRWCAGPNASRLQTGPDAWPERLPSAASIPTEVGVIAGGWSWWPSRRLPRPHDGRVSVASTKLEGMKDHVIVPAPHSWLVWNGQVLGLVRRFLATGSFQYGYSGPKG